MADTTNGRPDAAEQAEGLVWKVLKHNLEHQGTAEAVLYLRHLLHAEPGPVTEEGPYRRVSVDLYQRLSDYLARYNNVTGARMSWMFDALMENGGRLVSEEECLAVAEAAAQAPPEAELEVAAYEEQAGVPVFVARWKHLHNGILVERDYIQVLVNGRTGKAFALRRKWHTVNEQLIER